MRPNGNKTIIRQATEPDIPLCVDAGQRIYDAAGGTSVNYDPGSVEKTLSDLVNSPTGVVLVVEIDGQIHGLLAGKIEPLPINRDALLATEIFRWLNVPGDVGQAGAELYDAFEDWADKMGAANIVLSSVESELIGKTERRLIWRSMRYEASARNA